MQSTNTTCPSLSPEQVKAKIHACWLGKAIGGTLGGPHEGKTGPLGLTFYDPVPSGILPNDDLDLQVVWLCYLLHHKLTAVTPDVFSDAWNRHVAFPWDEYGICHRNGAYGLTGHRLGAVDNFFSECMGAAIRSELWACVAPGDPERAAAFAWADAVCDHAGDGVWAEVFFAALESAAFIEHDRDRLIDIGLRFLPSGSRVRDAVELTRRAWLERQDWLAVREEILAVHENDNFTDVAANIAFTVLGWLAGEGDFGQSILIANNCGMDTDCTAATLGSILGIIDPACIPAEWLSPIGDAVILNPQIVDLSDVPKTLGELTAQTQQLAEQLADSHPRIGEIVSRAPQGGSDPTLRLPVAISFTDASVFESAAAPRNAGAESTALLPGHWINRCAADFAASVMLIRYTIQLDNEQEVLLMAWSQTRTRAWVDGEPTIPMEPDLVASRRPHPGAPSFHRGGPGHFSLPAPLSAGEHTLLVAWERPVSAADLVVGVADARTQEWLPFALAHVKD